MRQRAQRLFAEYGIAALVIHYAVFGVVFAGAWLLLRTGWRPESMAGKAGLATMAYALVKLTMPARLVVTAALVPLAARAWERMTGRRLARRVNPALVAADAAVDGLESCPIAVAIRPGDAVATASAAPASPVSPATSAAARPAVDAA